MARLKIRFVLRGHIDLNQRLKSIDLQSSFILKKFRNPVKDLGIAL